MGLCAVADIVVATADATFGFTEAKLGIIPAVISPFVVAKIGESHARALFTTGQRFDAERALRIGLVHEVVADEAALDARDRRAARRAADPPDRPLRVPRRRSSASFGRSTRRRRASTRSATSPSSGRRPRARRALAPSSRNGRPAGARDVGGPPEPDHSTQAPSRRAGRGGLALVGRPRCVSSRPRAGHAATPGRGRPRTSRIPDHTSPRCLASGPGGRSHGRVWRSENRRSDGLDRGRRSADRHPASRPRRLPQEPEAVLRLQRQHEHAELAVEPRHRQLPRRLDDGAPWPGRSDAPCLGRIAAGGPLFLRRGPAHTGRDIQ